MKKKRKPIDPRAQIALAAAGPLVLLVIGWVAVVGPHRAQAGKVSAQVYAAEEQIGQLVLANRRAATPEPIRAADIFRLSKAMPDSTDMPGIILQLNQVAEESGIRFTSIAPQAVPTQGTGYDMLKIDLAFSGNFYGLSDFLYRLRNLVGVRGGSLEADGRLFAVEKLSFVEGKPAFPNIDAALTLNAFVYGNTLPGAVPAPPPPIAQVPATTPATPAATAPAPGATASAAPTAGATG